jgi:hypothetical protein
MSELEVKLKRLKRRNFVAKYNYNKSKRHPSVKTYKRKPKYASLTDDALQQ